MLALARRATRNPNPTDTAALIQELRAELRAVLYPERVKQKTLNQLAGAWLPRKLKAIEGPATFEGRFRNHLLPALGKHTAGTLRRADVEAFLWGLVKGGLSHQTANHVRDGGRQLVEDAIENGEWPAANPFAKAKSLFIPEREYEVLTRSEASRLLAAFPWRWRPLFAVALYLGPRRKTIFNIRRDDVDLEQRVIRFRVTKTRRPIWRIPVPEQLLPYIKRALRDSEGEWLFTNRFGNQHRGECKTLARVLRKAFREAGIYRGDRLPAITFHGLRRCCSVLHQESGCHPWVVSRVLGHSQASLALVGSVRENMTARRYSAFSEGFIREQLNLLSLRRR